MNPLATIEIIDSIVPHGNADTLEIAKVGRFEAVVQIGKFKAGETIIFIHPDSNLPGDREWCKDLLKYCGNNGRVKAARLRGVWSMGIVIPLGTKVFETYEIEKAATEHLSYSSLGIGDEVSDMLGITKYEPPLPHDLSAKGGFPHFLQKTDETSWQNVRLLSETMIGSIVDVTLKIDGSSLTVYAIPISGEQVSGGICTRSMELKTDPNFTNVWLEVERKYNLIQRLKDYCWENCVSLALRGEVYGKGIQKSKVNPHCDKDRDVAFYGVWLIDERRETQPGEQYYYENVCREMGLPTVPMLEKSVPLTEELIQKYDSVIKSVSTGPEEFKRFEGVVIKGPYGSFKIISKHYDAEK